MTNPLDTDAGSELFSSYENDFKLLQAELNQKLDQISESSGEQRKSVIGQAEQALDEAAELVVYNIYYVYLQLRRARKPNSFDTYRLIKCA